MTLEDHVIGAEHVSDLESVCLATRNGDILLCNTQTGHVCTPHTSTDSLTRACMRESSATCRWSVWVV